MTQTKNKRALLLGAYGQTNLGDDLLMYNYLNYLQSLGFTSIHVNVSEVACVPRIIAKTFPNMRLFATYHTSFFALLKLIINADCIFYGGGTVYKELYATTGRGRYSVIVHVMLFNALARLCGKKVVGLHIGIGTIKTAFGRFVTRLALLACAKTTFRDEKSYAYARSVLKLPLRIISYSTDGLFLNTRWRSEWHKAKLPVTRKKFKNIVGINMLSDIPDWVDRKIYLGTMRKFVCDLLEDNNYVVFLPFQTSFSAHNDLAFMQSEVIPHLQNFTNYTIAEDLDISTIVSYLRHIDILVGMRFHSLLLAAAARTPFLAVAYDTKCWRFVGEIGYDYAIKIEELEGQKLTRLYQELVANKTLAKATLQQVEKTNFKAADSWKNSQA